MEQPQNTTPGPWMVAQPSQGPRVIVSQVNHRRVAVAATLPWDADLVLLASAPELYDALVRLADWVEDSDAPESYGVLADARAALRRAGRTA